MGEKLLLDPNDPFFEPDQVAIVGASGSCYCCNHQIHVPFKHMDDLPLAKINKEHYYVFLCDQCEEDIVVLNDSGIHKVSYDVLWVIQDPLENELFVLEERNGGITSIERDALLINLYTEVARKVSNSSNKQLESLSDGETDEPKRKSKKDS